MNGKLAGKVFLGVCVVLTLLLVTGFITPLTGGCAFAIALILIAGFSEGFRKSKNPN